MAFDWQEYFSLARELSQRSEEAALRSAISHVYHAAFCTARNYLRPRGESIPDSEHSHKAVWDSFRRKGKSAQAVFINGERLKSRRRQADYEDEFNQLSQEVAASFRSAENVFHWLHELTRQDSADKTS
jgi:uncharacterized protein (UPF0332 family)